MTPSLFIPRRLDVAEICQEAAERAGVEFRSGYALTTARRSLELLQLEWANRGLNLWTIDAFPVQLLANIPDYVLPADTIDVLDAALRDWPSDFGGTYYGGQQDVILNRIALGDWPSLTAKRQPGKPTGVLFERTDPMRMHPWPVPDRDATMICWRLRYMLPLIPGGTGSLDMPVRFLPAMIAGLAYFLSLKSKSAERMQMLKMLYENEFELAANEDRDRASVFLVPAQGY